MPLGQEKPRAEKKKANATNCQVLQIANSLSCRTHTYMGLCTYVRTDLVRTYSKLRTYSKAFSHQPTYKSRRSILPVLGNGLRCSLAIAQLLLMLHIVLFLRKLHSLLVPRRLFFGLSANRYSLSALLSAYVRTQENVRNYVRTHALPSTSSAFSSSFSASGTACRKKFLSALFCATWSRETKSRKKKRPMPQIAKSCRLPTH